MPSRRDRRWHRLGSGGTHGRDRLVQYHYNLAGCSAEDVLDHGEDEGLGFIPWFALAAGDVAEPGGALDRAALSRRPARSRWRGCCGARG
jgi:aryl-alcohol dehydrogenase-like predicted oxidoreductase